MVLEVYRTIETLGTRRLQVLFYSVLVIIPTAEGHEYHWMEQVLEYDLHVVMPCHLIA
uniref:Uncharacterized protein n=1 Tax=Setaria italica TaxID=4555 RepID=K4A3R8_SETIT